MSLLPNTSWAWGAQGHHITGRVAEAFLAPRTRIAIQDLLGGETLADASTWMDQEKRPLGPAKAQWHYSNQAVCGAPAIRCPRGNCLTTRLPALIEEVGDARLSQAQRAAALRMVIHLMGDLHQPLHVANNEDRGGNDVTVIFAGARKALERNLHEVWDVELVKQELRGISEEQYAEQLIVSAKTNLDAIRRGGLGEWSSHGYTLAREVAYADLPGWQCSRTPPTVSTLDARYLTTGRAVVRAQLRDAGVRLADVLNRALGHGA
ncbi:S1/P1 nuclease [Niveibacterium sp. SC-1]|uniref:S1/P1 nuclease n=1 Tax=Niveibacterium sp. SC-1 TaxID=3135646 RepID=UPI0031203780